MIALSSGDADHRGHQDEQELNPSDAELLLPGGSRPSMPDRTNNGIVGTHEGDERGGGERDDELLVYLRQYRIRRTNVDQRFTLGTLRSRSRARDRTRGIRGARSG